MSRLDELQELYDELPNIDCQQRCWDSCGPIDMTGLERSRIQREAKVFIPVGSFVSDGPAMCPALTMFRQCAVYEIRPLICRLWGLSRGLPCTYGCRPERLLTEVEMYEFLARAYEIAGEHANARMVRAANDPKNRELLMQARAAMDEMSRETARRHGMTW